MESTKPSLLSQHSSTQFPQSSTHCYSSTQQACYMDQQLGYSHTQQHELFGQYNNLGVPPALPLPDAREVILREIEKERIRARMMMIEIAKMRGTEVTRVGAADIREKKLKSATRNKKLANPAKAISGSKSKVVKPPIAGTCKHPSDSILYEKAEVIATTESSLKETSIKAKSPGKNSRIRKTVADTVLLKQTEFLENPNPDLENYQAKTIQSVQTNGDPKKIIFKDNHDVTIFDSKSKAVILPIEDDSECPFDIILHKKALGEQSWGVSNDTNESALNEYLPEDDDVYAKGKWSCDLCQVIAVTVSALNEFLLGRKQKLKEASLKTSPPGTDSIVGNIAAASLSKETESLENSQSDQLNIIQSVNDDPKRTTYSSWHEKCQAGTSCEKDLNDREEEIVQNGENGPCIEKEKIEEPVNCDKYISDEGGKIILSNNVNVVSADARLKLENTLDTSDDGFETFLIRIGTLDLGFSDVKSVSENFKEEKIVQYDDSVPYIETKIDEPVNCDNHHIYEGTKIILSNNVDMVSVEARLGLEKLDTSEIGFETSLIQVGTVDIRNSEVKPVADAIKEEEMVQNGEFDLCIEKIEERDKHISELGKSILSNGLDVVSAETRLELEKPLDTPDFVFETSLIQFGTIDLSVSEVKPIAEGDEVVQNGESGPCIEEKIAEPMTCEKHFSEGGKIIFPNNVDVISAESGIKLENPLNTSDNGSKTFLIQFGSVEHRVSEVKPMAENDNKEEITLLANPDADSSKCPSDIILYKKAEGEQISVVTTESAYIEQLCGMKNKLEEGSLKSQSSGKNIGRISRDTLLDPESTNFKKDASSQKKGGLENNNNNFWREMRRIRTSFDKVVTDEEKGREDANHPKEILHTTETTCNQKENIEVSVNCDEHRSEKCIISDHVGFVSPEARLELHNPLDASDNKFETNKSGSKWKAVTPTALKNMGQKKYKLKEDSLNPQSPGKHSGIGIFSRDTLLSKQSELLVNLQSDSFNKDHSKTIQSVQKNGDPKITKGVLWRERNQVGTSSDKVANDEEKGRKQIGIVQNGETGLCDPMEKIDEPVNPVKHNSEDGKFIFPHILVKQDAKAAGVDIIKSGDSSTLHAILPTDGETTVNLVQHMDERVQNGETGLCDPMEKIDEPVNLAKHISEIGKFIFPHIIVKQDAKAAGVDIMKSGDSSTFHAILPKDGETTVNLVKHIDERVQNGETGPCDPMKKIDEPVNTVKHISEVGKFVLPHILVKQDANAGVDILKSGDSSTLHAVLPKDGETTARGEWNCTLCQVVTPNESSMNEHLCGKKHKLKVASLRTLRPGNDSSTNAAIVTLLEHSKSDNIIKDTAKTIKSVGRYGDLKKTKCNYWSKSCQVGPLEKLTYNLEKGKESAEIDEHEPCNPKEKMEVSVDCVEHVSERENTFRDYQKSDNIDENSAKTIRSVGENGQLKKTKYSYWRGSCQAGPSEKETYNLAKGKESDKCGPRNQKEKMEAPVNCVWRVSESEKFSGVVAGQAKLELPKPLVATNSGGHKRVEKQTEKKWQIKK